MTFGRFLWMSVVCVALCVSPKPTLELSLVSLVDNSPLAGGTLLPVIGVDEQLSGGPLTVGLLWPVAATGKNESLPLTGSLCQTTAPTLPKALAAASSVVVLWEIDQACSLLLHLPSLFQIPSVRGVLVYGSLRDGEDKGLLASTFALPVFQLLRVDALALKETVLRLETLQVPHEEQGQQQQKNDSLIPATPCALQVTLIPVTATLGDSGSSDGDYTLLHFSLSLLSILLCTSFLLSVLMNYYFFEAQQQRRRREAEEQLLMFMSMEAGAHTFMIRPSNGSAPRLLSHADLAKFPTWEFSIDGIALEKKRRQRLFKSLKKCAPLNPSVSAKASLASIRTTTSTVITSDSSGGDACPVCLENFDNGDLVREMDCSHWFHAKCIGMSFPVECVTNALKLASRYYRPVVNDSMCQLSNV